MIEIKNLEERDLPGLKVLYEDAFEGSHTDFNKMYLAFMQIKNQKNYVILCALENGTVVGSVLGVICSELFGQCRPFMVLEDVAVMKSHRRRGIARQLMAEIENHARGAGCSMIIFVSSEHRTGAHKLYESIGYGADKVNGYRKRLE